MYFHDILPDLNLLPLPCPTALVLGSPVLDTPVTFQQPVNLFKLAFLDQRKLHLDHLRPSGYLQKVCGSVQLCHIAPKVIFPILAHILIHTF